MSNFTKMIPTLNDSYLCGAHNIEVVEEDDDVTVVTSNVSHTSCKDANQDQEHEQPSQMFGPAHKRYTVSRKDAWQRMVEMKSLRDIDQAHLAFNTHKVVRAVEMAISDSGATGHF
jgi:hypothetical protein